MSVTTKDLTKLTGPQKVAIVLLSLTEENSTKIFAMMGEEEIKEISHAMSHLGTVDPEIISKVVEELHNDLTGDTLFMGNLHTTEKLLAKILDKDRVQTLLDEIRGPQGRNTWEKLSNVNEEMLALYFRNEHPQTAALVLSKISPDHAAKVLANLPDSFAYEIINRILSIGTVKKEVLERVERTLRAEFISSVGETQKYDSFEMVAEIFNRLDRNSESKYMGMLETNAPDAATKIKQLMFTFEDLIKIDPKGIQRILRDIEKAKLTLALKGASEQIRKVFLSNMSQRAANIILEEIAALGPKRVSEIDAARKVVVTLAKSLIDSGEIEFSQDSKDEFIN